MKYTGTYRLWLLGDFPWETVVPAATWRTTQFKTRKGPQKPSTPDTRKTKELKDQVTCINVRMLVIKSGHFPESFKFTILFLMVLKNIRCLGNQPIIKVNLINRPHSKVSHKSNKTTKIPCTDFKNMLFLLFSIDSW